METSRDLSIPTPPYPHITAPLLTAPDTRQVQISHFASPALLLPRIPFFLLLAPRHNAINALAFQHNQSIFPCARTRNTSVSNFACAASSFHNPPNSSLLPLLCRVLPYHLTRPIYAICTSPSASCTCSDSPASLSSAICASACPSAAATTTPSDSASSNVCFSC